MTEEDGGYNVLSSGDKKDAIINVEKKHDQVDDFDAEIKNPTSQLMKERCDKFIIEHSHEIDGFKKHYREFLRAFIKKYQYTVAVIKDVNSIQKPMASIEVELVILRAYLYTILSGEVEKWMAKKPKDKDLEKVRKELEHKHKELDVPKVPERVEKKKDVKPVVTPRNHKKHNHDDDDDEHDKHDDKHDDEHEHDDKHDDEHDDDDEHDKRNKKHDDEHDKIRNKKHNKKRDKKHDKHNSDSDDEDDESDSDVNDDSSDSEYDDMEDKFDPEHVHHHDAKDYHGDDDIFVGSLDFDSVVDEEFIYTCYKQEFKKSYDKYWQHIKRFEENRKANKIASKGKGKGKGKGKVKGKHKIKLSNIHNPPDYPKKLDTKRTGILKFSTANVFARTLTTTLFMHVGKLANQGEVTKKLEFMIKKIHQIVHEKLPLYPHSDVVDAVADYMNDESYFSKDLTDKLDYTDALDVATYFKQDIFEIFEYVDADVSGRLDVSELRICINLMTDRIKLPWLYSVLDPTKKKKLRYDLDKIEFLDYLIHSTLKLDEKFASHTKQTVQYVTDTKPEPPSGGLKTYLDLYVVPFRAVWTQPTWFKKFLGLIFIFPILFMANYGGIASVLLLHLGYLKDHKVDDIFIIYEAYFPLLLPLLVSAYVALAYRSDGNVKNVYVAGANTLRVSARSVRDVNEADTIYLSAIMKDAESKPDNIDWASVGVILLVIVHCLLPGVLRSIDGQKFGGDTWHLQLISAIFICVSLPYLVAICIFLLRCGIVLKQFAHQIDFIGNVISSRRSKNINRSSYYISPARAASLKLWDILRAACIDKNIGAVQDSTALVGPCLAAVVIFSGVVVASVLFKLQLGTYGIIVISFDVAIFATFTMRILHHFVHINHTLQEVHPDILLREKIRLHDMVSDDKDSKEKERTLRNIQYIDNVLQRLTLKDQQVTLYGFVLDKSFTTKLKSLISGGILALGTTVARGMLA